MRTLFCLALVGALALVGCGGKDKAGSPPDSSPPPPPDSAPNPKPSTPAVNLDGTYGVTKGFYFGKWDEKASHNFDKEIVVVIKGDTMTENLMGKQQTEKIKIDTTKSPAHFDMMPEKASGKNDTMRGIFKVEGDTLTLCFANDEKADEGRPKDFEPTPKSMIFVLKRK